MVVKQYFLFASLSPHLNIKDYANGWDVLVGRRGSFASLNSPSFFFSFFFYFLSYENGQPIQ